MKEVGEMLYAMWKERKGKVIMEEVKEKSEVRQNGREREIPEI